MAYRVLPLFVAVVLGLLCFHASATETSSKQGGLRLGLGLTALLRSSHSSHDNATDMPSKTDKHDHYEDNKPVIPLVLNTAIKAGAYIKAHPLTLSGSVKAKACVCTKVCPKDCVCGCSINGKPDCVRRPMHTMKPTMKPMEPTKMPTEPTKMPEMLGHTMKPTDKPEHTMKPTDKPEHTMKPTHKPEHTMKPTHKPEHTMKPKCVYNKACVKGYVCGCASKGLNICVKAAVNTSIVGKIGNLVNVRGAAHVGATVSGLMG